MIFELGRCFSNLWVSRAFFASIDLALVSGLRLQSPDTVTKSLHLFMYLGNEAETKILTTKAAKQTLKMGELFNIRTVLKLTRDPESL